MANQALRSRDGIPRIAALLTLAALAACGTRPEQSASPPPVVSTRATAFTNLDLGACLSIARRTMEPSESACPAFVSEGLVEMAATCTEAGGRLEPGQRPSVASLDVNGDGTAELLYNAADNYRCDTAPSLFDCGSLGCSVPLFEHQSRGWSLIGAFRSNDTPGLEVLAPEPGGRYGMLRGGCAGDRPCEEWTYYRWDGRAYVAAMIEARGHPVDLANGGGLWTLVRDTAVLASPSPDAVVLDRYPMGTDVVLLGDARDAAGYKYVSPCNACRNGFIEATSVRRPNY